MADMSSTQGRALVATRILPAYQQVADQLRDSILRGDVRPGERLPVESGLATLFGVSRSTIREALRVLTSERLVRTVRGVGGGTFVLQPDPGHVSEFLQTSIGLLTGTHQVSLAELVEARERLEVPAARLAAERAGADEIAELREVAAAELAATDEGYEQSRDFHIVLLRMGGNRLIEVLAGPVFSVLAQRYLGDISAAEWSLLESDHQEILEAVAAGDGETASSLMSDHIAAVGRLYREREAAGPS